MKIPSGSLMMGASADDPDAEWNERPAFPVAVTGSYYLATKPVTVRDFERFRSLPAGEHRATESDHAANYLSALDADAFVEWLSGERPAAEPPLRYRLPMEAEWEYACRAGTRSRFSYGDDPDYAHLGEYAWYAENAWHAGARSPQRPGGKRSNPWGLYDMHGNVWEWTSDGWGLYEEIARHGAAARDPSTRVLRGGAWCHDARYLRASDRDHYAPEYRHYYTGMRLAFDWP